MINRRLSFLFFSTYFLFFVYLVYPMLKRHENPFEFYPWTECFIPSNAIFHQFRESKKPESRLGIFVLSPLRSIDPLKRIFLVSRYFFHFIKTIPKAKGSGVGGQERDKRGISRIHCFFRG